MLRQEVINMITRLPEDQLSIVIDYLKTIAYQKQRASVVDLGQNGTAFLLSIAGMFDSGMNKGSEEVNTVVSDFIREKYGDTLIDSAD